MSRIPYGCDQQGRYPEAAEACSEIGADQDELGDDSPGMRLLVISALLVFVMAVTVAIPWFVPVHQSRCEIAEISPDVPTAAKEQCRRAR